MATVQGEKTLTVLKISETGGNLQLFRRMVERAIRVASPRSWYTILTVNGKPMALMLSRSGILPQATTRGAMYVDAIRWLHDMETAAVAANSGSSVQGTSQPL